MNDLQHIMTPEIRTYRDLKKSSFAERFHIDLTLLYGLILVAAAGLVILYSANNQNIHLVEKQAMHFVLGFIVMIALAHIPPSKYRLWAPWLYGIALSLLFFVLLLGIIGKGAQRWLGMGIFHFQPSELMKFALPLCLAWYLSFDNLKLHHKRLFVAGIITLIPVLLIAKQPDLGTAILVGIGALSVLFFAGLSWRWLLSLCVIMLSSIPLLWHFLHEYQRQRVLTFLYPERDPLGSGYHIIQSKIAIGSGGLFGKGWLNGAQSHLDFLPEHTTDFIYAVCGEELGLIGCLGIVAIFLYLFGRCLYISAQAQDYFTRLLAGSLSLSFFFAVFINIGMVIGILPVVGLPLPLISYGGTAIVSTLASFGIIMSIHTHRKLVSS